VGREPSDVQVAFFDRLDVVPAVELPRQLYLPVEGEPGLGADQLRPFTSRYAEYFRDYDARGLE
jgi:hypothetical protein